MSNRGSRRSLAVESVWDYPRPPRLEPTSEHVVVWFGGEVMAETTRALRVLETSHPPVYAIPRGDVAFEYIVEAPTHTWCEFKGRASYGDLIVDGKVSRGACWWYADPSRGYEPLADHVSFFAARVDRCLVDGEVVRAQPSDFYGGWVTSRVAGPFKAGPGTWAW